MRNAGLQQPLIERHDYVAEEGSMADELDKMYHGEFISREQLASNLAKTAKEILAVNLDIDYTDDHKEQILGQIPILLRKMKDEANEFSQIVEQSIHSLGVLKTHLQDLVWIYGTSRDKRLRKAEIMLKALEKHEKTLEELPTYISRIANLVK